MASNGKLKTSTSKRQKVAKEFCADTIDSTGPVAKVLNDLQFKNTKAYELYCQTIRQRRTTKKNLQNFHYVLPGHPLCYFSEDWEGDVNHGYFESLRFISSLPKMITPMSNLLRQDPVTEVIKLKTDWHNANRAFRSAAVYSKLLGKYESLNEDVVYCPKHFIDIAAHMDSDPDRFFDSSYNWYYAGNGNLQLIHLDPTDYLLHSEFNFLYLTELSKERLALKNNSISKFDCGEKNYILETICSKQNVVALRTKNKIFILKIVCLDGKIDFNKLKATESEVPFTGISFDSFHNNILYITTLGNKLTFVNVDRLTAKTVKLKSNVNTLVDNWNTVLGSERAYFTHVARNSIIIYDKRSRNSIYTWEKVRDITDDINCNDICAAKQIEGTPSLYFGTDHHLFLMDLRYNGNHKPSVIQRWTHGMQCPPTYMSTCTYAFNEELICLSSQWCEDMCLVKNNVFSTNRKSEHFGVSIPYRPPSILKTLAEARQKLLCFDVYNPIDSRLSAAITGNVVFENGDKYIILMLNSLGDVSCNFLYAEHMAMFIEDLSCEELHEWCKNYKIHKENYDVSSIVNISRIWKLLKKIPEDQKVGEGQYEFRHKTKFNKQEIFDPYNNDELDNGLLDQWVDEDKNNTTMDQSSGTFNFHLSDSE